jgi:hypothetical protein
MDWQIYGCSRIERLPRLFQSPAIVARNVIVAARDRIAPFREHHHRHDSMSTRHNDDFMRTPDFQKASARAVKAAGWDYQIPYRVHQALWCARTARKVPGDFVELGTGRGYIMSAILADQPDFDRHVHLFDTFLPNHLKADGKQDSRTTSPHYAKSFEDVRENFAEWPFVRLHQGDVFDTLPDADIEAVAFLHVDMNYAPPEIFGLRHFWPLMPKGGIILLDDYAHANCRDQYRAMNKLAAEIGFDILSTPTGQGIIVK